MVKKIEKNCIAALDIGTSKIIALIGEILPDGAIQIIGYGHKPSFGLKRGVVVNIEDTVASIGGAVQEAELMANKVVRTVFTGIAGSHIRSLNSDGIAAIRGEEVSSADVERVLDAAKAVAIPADQKILHVIPQEFIIDGQVGILEPVGMAGVRLETRVHIVTGAVSAAQNIVKCVRRCGLEVGNIILEQLASAHAVLTKDEKELGVCLVDIGAGTTDIALFLGGSIQHSAVIPIAGDQVTNDIAMALRTSTKVAENIKIMHGSALPEWASAEQSIEVASGTDRPGKKISAKTLSEVVAARYEELFAYVRKVIAASGLTDRLAAGIVLTGGASLITGSTELAELCFEMPVRQGLAQGVSGLTEAMENPSFATAVGLLLYGHQQQLQGNYLVPARESAKGMWSRMREWFQGNF